MDLGRRPDDARAPVRAAAAAARQRLEARARARLEDSLARLRSALLPPAVTAGPPPAGRAVPLAPHPLPPMAAPRPLRLKLSDGRTAWAVAPAIARRAELGAIARTSAANDEAAFRALARHARAIEALGRRCAEVQDRLAELEERSDLALVGLVEGLSRMRHRVDGVRRAQDRAAVAGRSAERARGLRERALRAELGAERTSARIDRVTSVVTSLQDAAFGRTGSLLQRENLILAGNQLLWRFVDPLLRRLGLVSGPAPSTLALLAPLGSLATAQALLGSRQHVRFVSGKAVVAGRAGRGVPVPLRDRIASRTFEALRRRTDVPATAVVIGAVDRPAAPPPRIGIAASVRDGVLVLTPARSLAGAGNLLVAWTVDTGAGDG